MDKMQLVAYGEQSEWSELAGPFEHSQDALDWIAEPPEDMEYRGRVRVVQRRVSAFYVLAEETRAVAA